MPPSWRLQARRLVGTLTNLLFPPVCANCKKGGAYLCATCTEAVMWLHEPLCPHCGCELDRQADRCYPCAQRPLPLAQVRTAVYFADPVQPLIHQLKYQNSFALAPTLADLLIKAWPVWSHPVDVMVSIPLHADRQRARGYNQSQLLAEPLSRQVGIPLLPQAMRRVRPTQPQVGLNAVDRHANVSGAFVAERSLIDGRHVLLIDDVFTTGATMSAAAEVLLTAGAARVSGFCLARAKQR